MKRELFIPYKDTILRCIASCITPEQFHVCYDLMERFEERFRGVVTVEELNEASIELHSAYQMKKEPLTII